MLKRGLTLALVTLVLCACQTDPNTVNYSGSSNRQQECDRILAQLGVSGDAVLEPETASTPERKKLVGMYSAYGCDK
ncbi:MAG: hypothetical protein K2Q33_07150 [Gammaproteobacteria bacterium]|nr:hypothetical protein [Gammaproteobacteria bacterium]